MRSTGHFPFSCFPVKCACAAQISPFSWRVIQHRRHLWFTHCSGLDFACRPFRFSLAEDTLSTLPFIERGLYTGYGTLKGKVTEWILTT
jgi:hypothetical protein